MMVSRVTSVIKASRDNGTFPLLSSKLALTLKQARQRIVAVCTAIWGLASLQTGRYSIVLTHISVYV